MKEQNSIVVSRLETSSFTVDDIIELMHASFVEHLDEGLHFTCSTMTAEQFSQRTANSIVFVAYREGEHELIGTATVTLRRDSGGVIYGYNEYNAVSPNAKRLGIGSRLLRESVCVVKAEGGQYIMSDTAVGAHSSVAYHLKNGFRKVGLRSYPSTNYYSYLFRMQLAPSWKWNSKIYTSARFLLSSVIVRLVFKADGTETNIGKILKSVMKR